MSIEALLKEHIEALNRNTAALEAVAGSGKPADAAETTTKTTTRTASKTGAKTTTTKKAGKSVDETTAALLKLKDEFGLEHAKAVLSKHGFKQMKDMTEDKFDAVFKDASDKYTELSDAGDDDGDDDGDI